MYYKVIKSERSVFRDKTTDEIKVLLAGEFVYTPSGEINPSDYLWFDSKDEAVEYFNLQKYDKVQKEIVE